MKLLNFSLTLTAALFFSATSASAITIDVDVPNGATLSVLKSDENDLFISGATSSTQMIAEGTKGQLFFNARDAENETVTNEVILAVVKKKRNRSGKKVLKVFTMEQAVAKNLCRKKGVKGIIYFKKDVTDELQTSYELQYDEDGNPTHATLTTITGVSNFKKKLKSYVSTKKADRVSLNSDCSRADGNGL